MSRSTAKGNVLAKYGSRMDQAVSAHSGDETEYGPMRLPGGIKGGVAQLEECYFDIYKTGPNQGEAYFRAVGRVIEPAEYFGWTTSIMFPVCETKNKKGEITTQDEYVELILNELRKLGADTSKLKRGSDMEALASALVSPEAMPYFRFSTTQSAPTTEYPNPRVWENWHGTKGLENFDPSTNVASQITDNTTRVANPNGATATSTKPSKSGPGFSDQSDLVTLVKRAQKGDELAIEELTELAKSAGLDEDTIANTSTWQEVADLIQGLGSDTGEAVEDQEQIEEAEELEATWEPMVEEIYGFRPVDPKTKRPVKDVQEFEITEVDKNKRVVSLKSIVNPKLLYKNVSWDRLEKST